MDQNQVGPENEAVKSHDMQPIGGGQKVVDLGVVSRDMGCNLNKSFGLKGKIVGGKGFLILG